MTREQLIQGLNDDLSAEWGTIIRYTYQSARSFGLPGAEVRELLKPELRDELEHATFLTDVIIDLGGEPTTAPASFEKPSTLKEMLEIDQMSELSDVKNYREHAAWADELGEMELKVKLEEMAADEAGHARDIRRILKGM